tara:strand:+ start:782 stop:1147 length:366 start_codon:yes stop_codon:yes gene_type:complete
MKKAVKEVVKTVKAVKVEVQENQIDRRMFNPGRPKSKEAQDQDEFVYNLTQGQVFTVGGLNGDFNLNLSQDNYLRKNGVKVGILTNTYPSKLKFETTTKIGNTVDYVIKFKDIELKELVVK